MSLEALTFEDRDDFQRKPIAEKVINLLESNIQVSPMIIDGNWGTGKTEFCRKLIHLIESSDSNLRSVYIDAFKADHADEPLLTLLSAILKLLPEAKRPSLMKAALPVARFAARISLKAGVSWVLRQDAAGIADGFASDLKSAGDEAVNHAVESLLTDHVEAEERIETLKQALQTIAEGSPIVIFVDELDRCRPDFAVSMLESIKHVFDVDHVQFVLVTNSVQLRASINHCYGAAIEAQRYLDKFIAFSFRLPERFSPNGHLPTSASIYHMHQLIGGSKSLSPGFNKNGYIEFIDLLIRENQLSLREVETFVQHMELYQILTAQKGLADNTIYGYKNLRLFGVFLFCFRSDLASQLIQGVIDAEAIAATVGKSKLVNIKDLKGAYPDSGDIISVFIGGEASVNGEAFKPRDEAAIKQWGEIFQGFFNNQAPYDGKVVPIIVSTIESLQLGGQ